MQLDDELRKYEKTLRKNRLAPEKHVRFYVSWVREFLLFCGTGAKERRDETAAFAEALKKRPNIADWQVRQADDAVEIFIQSLENRQPLLSPAGNIKLSSAKVQIAWESALEEMKRLMGLRHYSVRTEQAYLDWVRRFAPRGVRHHWNQCPTSNRIDVRPRIE